MSVTICQYFVYRREMSFNMILREFSEESSSYPRSREISALYDTNEDFYYFIRSGYDFFYFYYIIYVYTIYIYIYREPRNIYIMINTSRTRVYRCGVICAHREYVWLFCAPSFFFFCFFDPQYGFTLPPIPSQRRLGDIIYKNRNHGFNKVLSTKRKTRYEKKKK